MNLEGKLHDNLEKHIDIWVEMGTSDFIVWGVMNGYVLQFYEVSQKYKENNKELYIDE